MKYYDWEPEQLVRELKSKMNSDSDQELYHIIHALGEKGVVQAEGLIKPYLKSKDYSLRQIALSVLMHHWGLHKYVETCKSLLIHDESEDVRSMAALCLGTAYKAKKDKKVLDLLVTKLKDEEESWWVRQESYDSIVRILDSPQLSRLPTTRKADLNKDIDWKTLDRLVTE